MICEVRTVQPIFLPEMQLKRSNSSRLGHRNARYAVLVLDSGDNLKACSLCQCGTAEHVTAQKSRRRCGTLTILPQTPAHFFLQVPVTPRTRDPITMLAVTEPHQGADIHQSWSQSWDRGTSRCTRTCCGCTSSSRRRSACRYRMRWSLT